MWQGIEPEEKQQFIETFQKIIKIRRSGGLMLRHMHYKGIRIPVFILSILINALGIDLIIVAGFGSSPISSVPIVISLYSNWTFGEITFLANILFIAAQIALLRRQFRPIEGLQLGISIIFSASLDLYMPFLSGLQGHSWPVAFLILLMGCAVPPSASAWKWPRRSSWFPVTAL